MPTDEVGQPESQDPTFENGQFVELKAIPQRRADDGFEDLSATRRKLSAQIAVNARLEVEHLKKLLSAQDAAKHHAQATAAELHRNLKLLENENGRIRLDLRKAQDQLASAKQEQLVELRRAADREETLRAEVVNARGQASNALDSASVYRKKGAGILLVVAVSISIWVAANHWHSSGASANAPDTSASDTAPPVRTATAKPQPASHDFAGALGRLDSALGAFSGEKPESVLRRVHLANAARGVAVCSFEWNNGEVSLEFGNKAGVALDTALAECAEAVEKSAK